MKPASLQHILFAGPSGIGKTTLAEELSSEDREFMSGSVSNLIPKTEKMLHSEMLQRDAKELYVEDYQILNIRNKLCNERKNTSYVSDRSFLDSAAYFYLKQADKIPACEMEQFLNNAKKCLCSHCTHLILVDFLPSQIDQWITECNDKRITSNYFQVEVANLMKLVLKIWGYKFRFGYNSLKKGIFGYDTLEYGADAGIIESIYGNVKVLILKELNHTKRIELIKEFLDYDESKGHRFSIF
jgi:hypothetical protein